MQCFIRKYTQLAFTCFFSIRIFFHGNWTHSKIRERRWTSSNLSITSSLLLTFRHLFEVLHVRDQHVFLMSSHVTTKLLLYQCQSQFYLIMLDLYCSNLSHTSGAFELQSTITLGLQVNRQTRYANHPNTSCSCAIMKTAELCRYWHFQEYYYILPVNRNIINKGNAVFWCSIMIVNYFVKLPTE